MKRLLLLFIPLIIAGLLFLGFRYISSSGANVSALQVTATPQAEVFLNNISLGKTPLYNDKLKPGEHTLKLVPQAAAETSSPGLFNFEEKITLREGILTVVDRIFKSTEAESEVSILSLERLAQRKAVEIAVISTPAGAEVKLDEQPQGVTPLLLKDVSISDHQITLMKEGYNNKTLRVRPNEGYRLTASVKLSILRIVGESVAPPTASATVRILETPIGFLRVREAASTASREIARVKPGETFPFLEEKEGWFKIQLSDASEGWVSSQYATRQEPD